MKKVYQFFILTFLISWVLWSPLYFSKEINEFWALPGAWGPTISAILVTWMHEGKTGVKQLLKKLLIWRISVKYYLFAIGLSSFIAILAMLLANLFFNVDLNFSSIPEGIGLEDNDFLLSLLLLPVIFLITCLVGGPIAEELGWRGFAQEKLQIKYGETPSGLIIGFFWILWHLPLMIFLPQGVGHMPTVAYIFVMINMSVLFAWLYNKTKGSVLLAIIFHAGINFENTILGSENLQDTSTLIIFIILLTTLNLLIQYRRKFFFQSNFIKSKSFLILMFLFCAISGHPQDYRKAIDKARFLIENHKQQTQIPGCQIAVMVKGKLVWSESFGFSDIENKVEVSANIKFRIASVSKPVTAMALGKLINDKKINIDENIRTYLPSFPKKEYEITSRHLASSTSGIRHYTSSDDSFNTKSYENVVASLERFSNDPLAVKPGSQFLYSSYGWVLLSAVMEKASGTSFFELMQNTWDELGMKNTTFDFPDRKIDQKSKFYVYDKKQKRKLAPPENRSYMYAGGGYLSTAQDLVQMGNKFINTDFLNKETRELLTTSYVLENGTPTYYGLGWETGISRLDTEVVYHSGSLPTSVAHLIIYPKEEVVLAYLANTGDNVFFNAREAQTIAELFINQKRYTHEQIEDLEGKWNISTTSLRDKKTTGTLHLSLNNDGIVSGTISFKRSRKNITCPIVVATIENNKAYCIAVSPMFIDFYLEFKNNEFNGVWLHDFNVKGIPEKDNYWEPRKINGSKI